MRKKWKLFLIDEKGATAIEYSLIALFISVAVIGGATNIGTNVDNILNNTASNF